VTGEEIEDLENRKRDRDRQTDRDRGRYKDRDIRRIRATKSRNKRAKAISWKEEEKINAAEYRGKFSNQQKLILALGMVDKFATLNEFRETLFAFSNFF